VLLHSFVCSTTQHATSCSCSTACLLEKCVAVDKSCKGKDLITWELSTQPVNATKRARADAGWEWDSPWEVELSPYVDKEGWAYAPDWAAMDWPPQNGAQVSPWIY